MQKNQNIKRKRIKKDKNCHLYVVNNKNKIYLDEEQKIPYIACVTANELEAKEFIDRKLLLDNYQHFKAWCELKDLKEEKLSWEQYKKITQVENPYFYFKFEFGYHMIASILRIFYGCAPIGCSFDTLMETANALVQIPEEEYKKINEKLNESIKSQEQ